MIEAPRFFTACDYCEAAPWLAEVDRETAVSFGQSAVMSASILSDRLMLTEQDINAEIARSRRLGRLPEEATDLLRACAQTHLEGRCTEKVERSRTMQVNERYL